MRKKQQLKINYSATVTVEPLVSDHPEYKAKVVAYGRWMLVSCC